MIAVLLLLIGAYAAYWWFYKLAPVRRALDPIWHSSHSQQEYWVEVQGAIHSGVWMHDDGFTVGKFGDKSWAKWIMKKVKPGDSMNCFGSPCHSASSMSLITNQDIGDNADDWLEWWGKNWSKSQEEWIADGFHLKEVNIDVPPRPEQHLVLLALLGDSEPDEFYSVPRHLEYNAFRCLRDTGFDAVKFVIANKELSPEIERGLLRYAKFEHRWPSASNVGILPFANTERDELGRPLPRILGWQFQAVVYLLIFIPVLTGIALLVRSKKAAWKVVEQAESLKP